jgi:hypothetical protein
LLKCWQPEFRGEFPYTLFSPEEYPQGVEPIRTWKVCHAIRKISDFHPESVVGKSQHVKELLEFRQLIRLIKAPLGGIRGFRRDIQGMLGSEVQRFEHHRQLGYTKGEGLRAEAIHLFSSSHIEHIIKNIELVRDGESNRSFLDKMMAYNHLTPGDEFYPQFRSGIISLLSEMLHPECRTIAFDAHVIDTIIQRCDLRLGRQIDSLFRNQRWMALERTWRTLEQALSLRPSVEFHVVHVALQDLQQDPEGVQTWVQEQSRGDRCIDEPGNWVYWMYDWERDRDKHILTCLNHMAADADPSSTWMVGLCEQNVKEILGVSAQFDKCIWPFEHLLLSLSHLLLRCPYGNGAWVKAFDYKESNEWLLRGQVGAILLSWLAEEGKRRTSHIDLRFPFYQDWDANERTVKCVYPIVSNEQQRVWQRHGGLSIRYSAPGSTEVTLPAVLT